ncbi:atp18 subunit J of the mitochondrial F1F0 ATP synthase [Knufia obscura]|uniref:Atp18 subunit J of the mitochondrial F1F0 ATP synthase n=2 Tax=Knufia TaxID=430999 RepID=A0AAN8F2J7_9EURO|nr:atp18 subunit J of the mitochondrial F1F0 ATP synthase [Knufia obscura]KAK5955228.1 atp18 subunit J of the mitochondrial F1F0 ATP synthase [Knufia fluminis]
MPGFLPKKFPGKMSEPMLPFFAAGLIVLYGVNAGAAAYMQSDEFKDDPRNPYAKESAKPQQKGGAQ